MVESLPMSTFNVWADDASNIGVDCGIVIFMLLRRHVQNRFLEWQQRNLKDVCLRFRWFMTDEICVVRKS